MTQFKLQYGFHNSWQMKWAGSCSLIPSLSIGSMKNWEIWSGKVHRYKANGSSYFMEWNTTLIHNLLQSCTCLVYRLSICIEDTCLVSLVPKP